MQALSGLLAPVMAVMHGHNRGYFKVAIASPSPGDLEPGPLSWRAFVSGRTSALPVDALFELAPVAAELDRPTHHERARLSDRLHAIGRDAVDGGRGAPEGLLGRADFDPAAVRSGDRLAASADARGYAHSAVGGSGDADPVVGVSRELCLDGIHQVQVAHLVLVEAVVPP